MFEDNLQVIHPGKILAKEFLSRLGISRYRLGKETFMDTTRISEIISGERVLRRIPLYGCLSSWATRPSFG